MPAGASNVSPRDSSAITGPRTRNARVSPACIRSSRPGCTTANVTETAVSEKRLSIAAFCTAPAVWRRIASSRARIATSSVGSRSDVRPRSSESAATQEFLKPCCTERSATCGPRDQSSRCPEITASPTPCAPQTGPTPWNGSRARHCSKSVTKYASRLNLRFRPWCVAEATVRAVGGLPVRYTRQG